MKSITIYTDSSHGWAKVTLKELLKLNIIDKISTYSYIHKNGLYAYLEEDVDLSTYLKALDAKGIQYKFIEKNANKSSKIRSYSRYTLGHNYINPFYKSDKPIDVNINLL
jgi:coproporphyrinogen III oxidase-like Fe-S oxidoreductase